MAPPGDSRAHGKSPERDKSRSSSTPSLPAILTSPGRGIYGRQWTSENKRLLHEMKERSWLRQQGKQDMVYFSEQERMELRQYFEAIAEELAPRKKTERWPRQRRIRVDRLEDMLISLGLAANKFQVKEIVKAIDDKDSGELDFEQFLMIVRTRAHPAIFQVFKAMIDGKLGDRSLNFRTVISGYRRGMIMEATGATDGYRSKEIPGAEPETAVSKKADLHMAQKRGKRILENFANLQKTRFEKGEIRGDRGEAGEDAMPFDGSGFVPTGAMQQLWHTVCAEHSLVPSRPSSADKRTLEPPRSPREIIESIIQGKLMRSRKRRGTLVVVAPDQSAEAAKAMATSLSSASPDFRATSRPSTQEGNKDFSTRFV